jgi:hypothetical protein
VAGAGEFPLLSLLSQNLANENCNVILLLTCVVVMLLCFGPKAVWSLFEGVVWIDCLNCSMTRPRS